MKDVADGISRWLGSGGPQADSGAFCGWYDTATGQLSAAYPEITGYVLGFLAGGTGPESEAKSTRTVAQNAATWLVSRWRGGDRSARPEKTGPAIYTFDIGMQAHGLLRHGLRTADRDAISVGLDAAGFLIALIDTHGSLPAVVPGSALDAVPDTWSTTGRLHLLKTAQALLGAHELGLEGAAAAAHRLIREGLPNDGAMPPATCPGTDVISLHALCYAAEGLWVWGAYQSDAIALRRSREITAWVWRHRLPSGGFPGFVRSGYRLPDMRHQSDVTAQAIRLAALHRLDVDAEAEAMLVAAGAWLDGDHAALFYRPGSGERHLNTWTSMFAAQAFHVAGGMRPDLEWHELV